MKSRIKHIEECTKVLRIEMPEDLVKRTVEEVYKEIKKTAKIPGFRPGAAPQDLLEKHYSKDAEREVLKRLIPEGYKSALEFHNVTPAGLPDIANIDFAIGKPLTFEAQVDIRPAIKLKNYKGINVTKKTISISKAIEAQILARKENALRMDMENQILARLMKDNKFSVPSGLASRQKEVLARRMLEELLRNGIAKEDAEKKIKELDSKLEADAKTRIQVYFILDDIAIKEKIEVSEHDIDESLKAAALSAGRPVEEVRKYYEKENLLGGLAEEIKEAKVLEFLLKEAEIQEEKDKEVGHP